MTPDTPTPHDRDDAPRAGTATRAGADAVEFVLPDPDHRWSAVRLWQEVRIPGDRLDLTWTSGRTGGGGWRLRLDRPAVDRMEYLFELTGDGREMVLDPGNPLRVGGAFGDHSVIEFPDYHRPAWLALDSPTGTYRDLAFAGPLPVDGRLWTPAGLDDDEPAVLLVTHDGPEYDALAQLTRFLATLDVPVRAALLAPGHGTRDERYAANPAYSQTLTRTVLPHLRVLAPTTRVVGMGASLGALALLVAHRSAPRAVDALLLQSGSFFQRTTDSQERRFAHFARVARSVGGVLAAAGARRPVPVVMTCGGIEENLANNRAMARALRAQGYPVTLTEVRDVHNYTAWRDAFDPHLARLLTAAGTGF